MGEYVSWSQITGRINGTGIGVAVYSSVYNMGGNCCD